MPSLDQIQDACNAALEGEPPQDGRLFKDASHLATIVAELWHFKLDGRDISEFTPPQKAAYDRWKSSK